VYTHTYLGERQTYYDRRLQSQRKPHNYLSLNSDGMNQNNSKLPYLGGLCDFLKPLTQHIQGVLNHGDQEFIVYRTYNNVRKDRNMAIYCLLATIERHMEKNGVGSK
jgi:hypothetical protein